jgi:microcystin-dependent protein
MSDQFVAEIRMFGGSFAPQAWALCDGQLMPISQNTALFSLLGTTYGGDGKSTFALPNLQGMTPMQQGQGPGFSLRDLGETSGEETVILLQSEIPLHTHAVQGTATNASSNDPSNNVFASGHWVQGSKKGAMKANTTSVAQTDPKVVTMNPSTMSIAGSSFPHNNLMPYLTLTFIIALQGIFPPRG